MKKSYDERLKSELKHYKQIFKDRLFQEVPQVWNEVEKKFSEQIRRTAGVDGLPEYIAKHTAKRKRINLLSLGSGACGVELAMVAPLLKSQGTAMTLTSVDINDEILNQAKEEADKRDIDFLGVAQDINKLRLEPNSYDVIMAYAAMHHFEKLDKISAEINKALKPNGIFITVDIPTRNGYLMWPETRSLVDMIWQVLPKKYKWDHTVSKIPIYMSKYPDVDYSIGSFECANSEEIIPALRKHLKEVQYVPTFAFARRFFDTKFGPNFNLQKPVDRAIFELLMKLDQLLVEAQALKPETFFGVYVKKKASGRRSSLKRGRRRKD